MSDLTPQSMNKKARLGRGLGSLLGGAPEEASHSQASAPQPATVVAPSVTIQSPAPAKPVDETTVVWKIQIDRLRPNAQQPRQEFAGEALTDLTNSIREKGILQPIVARRLDEKSFEIIAGERRWRAAQAAGLHEVPVILKKVGEQDSLEFAIIENIQRADLNALEEAEAYDLLMQRYGLTQQNVADKVGKDRATVANALRTLALPKEVKELLRNDKISVGHAKALLALASAEEQIELANLISSKKLSVRESERLVHKAKAGKRSAINEVEKLHQDVSRKLITGLAEELQKLLGTKVSIDYAEGKGKLSLAFYSDEQLSSLVEKIKEAWEI